MIDGISDYAVFMLGPDGRVTTWNHGAERLTGHAAEYVLGLPLADVYGRAQWEDAAAEFLLNAAVTEAFGRHEGWYVRKNGDRCWLETTVTQLLDSVGGRRGFAVITHDSTDRKKFELALVAGENRLRAIIDTAIDAIITFDDEGRIESLNPAGEKLFGYSPQDLAGLDIRLLLSAHSYPDGNTTLFATAPLCPVGSGQEVVATCRDGSTFPAELAVSEFFVEDQRHFAGIIRDLTERKRIERLQAEFVSTVSHELRTPLTSIRGSLGLVAAGLTGDLPSEAKEYIDIAVTNSDRLVRLINDILDIEKMQSGRMEFRLKLVELDRIVRAVLTNNLAFAESHGVVLVLAGNAATGDVVADEDRLIQVLTNLISNAVKFSPRGQTVDVSVERTGEYLQVCVRDYGPGIPAEFRGRIFQRFAQADASNTREKGGTGLGLAISKSIVEHMHGQIGFAAAQGGGTVFFFKLPRVASLAEQQQMAAQESSTPLALVCEDDPDVASVLRRNLASVGLSVHHAPTIVRARHLLASNRYALVTLDLTLADGDATVLVTEIRNSPMASKTPILVVSGQARNFVHHRLGSSAFSVLDIIEKPFDDARLLESIRMATAARHGKLPKVLYVEDDGDLRRIVKRLLPKDWTIVEVDTIRAANRELAQSGFDLILLDMVLPDGGGEELLQHVGQTPVIIFSAAEVSPALAARVSHALVKSRISETELRDFVVHLIGGPTSARAAL